MADSGLAVGLADERNLGAPLWQTYAFSLGSVDRSSSEHDSPSVTAPPDLTDRTVPTDLTFRALAARHRRVAFSLTALMIAIYFGFILLIAFDKPLLGRELTRGLSLGILLGALVIVASWLLTWVYVRWANTHYDAELTRHRT